MGNFETELAEVKNLLPKEVHCPWCGGLMRYEITSRKEFNIESGGNYLSYARARYTCPSLKCRLVHLGEGRQVYAEWQPQLRKWYLGDFTPTD